MAHKQIYYSDKYFDEHYEYRHVMLPRELSKQVPKTHLMSEEEWRRLGVQQSLGWVHYMIHEPDNLTPKSSRFAVVINATGELAIQPFLLLPVVSAWLQVSAPDFGAVYCSLGVDRIPDTVQKLNKSRIFFSLDDLFQKINRNEV